MHGESVGATPMAPAPHGEGRAPKRTRWVGDVDDAVQATGLGIGGPAVLKSDVVAAEGAVAAPQEAHPEPPLEGGSFHRASTPVTQCPAQPPSRAHAGDHGGPAGQDQAQACSRGRCRTERRRAARVRPAARFAPGCGRSVRPGPRSARRACRASFMRGRLNGVTPQWRGG